MNVTRKPDLRTAGDYTRAINQISLHPSLSPVQRLVNLEVKADLLEGRARLRGARAAEVSRVRAAQLLQEAAEDRRLATALRKRYERLSRRSRS